MTAGAFEARLGIFRAIRDDRVAKVIRTSKAHLVGIHIRPEHVFQWQKRNLGGR